MRAELAAALLDLRAAVLWRLARRCGRAVTRDEVVALAGNHCDAEIVARLAAAPAMPAGRRPWQRLLERLRGTRPAPERRPDG